MTMLRMGVNRHWYWLKMFVSKKKEVNPIDTDRIRNATTVAPYIYNTSDEAQPRSCLKAKLAKDKILSDHESIPTALSKKLADNLLVVVRVEGGTSAMAPMQFVSMFPLE